MRRTGAVTFWLGLLLSVAALVVAAIVGARTFEELRTALDGVRSMPGGGASVTLAQGERQVIYQELTDGGAPSAVCEVGDPQAEPVPLTPNPALEGSVAWLAYGVVGEFEAPSAGRHTVSCEGGTTFVGPPVDLDRIGRTVLIGVGSVLALGAGVFLMLVGAVLWFIGRSRRRRLPGAVSSGAPPYGTPPPPPAH